MIITLILILASIPISIVFILYWYLVRPEKKVYDELRRQGIPGEPFVPIIGQMPEIRRARDNGSLMDYHLTLAKKYGPVFLIGYGPLVRLVVLEPDLLADVFSRNFANYYRKPIDFTTVLKPIVGEHNVLVSEGTEHERARKMLNPAFNFISLQSMIPIMTNQTERFISNWINSTNNQPINLTKELNALTLSIITSSAFGQSIETLSSAHDSICKIFPEVLEAVMYRTMRMVNLIPWLARLPFWRKHIVDEGMQKLTEIVEMIILQRKLGKSTSTHDNRDLLELLMNAVDDKGESFTDDEIRDQALTFMLAGHDTTGNLMVWVVYVLMMHDDVLRECQEEVDRILSKDKIPNLEHLNEMHVCEAVIMETLRLYPPAPLVTRYCMKEHTIGRKDSFQLRIPVHTTVWLNSYSLHRREEFWPQPLQFDYKRWLRNSNTGLKPKLAHPFCYLPFAAGPRNCIGQHFALLEAKAILSLLVKRCNFLYEPTQTVTPDLRITMRPKYPIYAKITERI